MKFCKSTLHLRKDLLTLFNPCTKLNIVEVGVYLGHFARQLDSEMINLLTLVDPWNSPQCEGQMVGGETEYQELFDWCKGLGYVHLVRKYSQQAVARFNDESLDMVYLDAEHTYDGVLADIKLWYPKVKQGGILAGHDIFAPEHIGVTQAVMDALPLEIVFVIPAETCPFTGNTVNPTWYIVK